MDSAAVVWLVTAVVLGGAALAMGRSVWSQRSHLVEPLTPPLQLSRYDVRLQLAGTIIFALASMFAVLSLLVPSRMALWRACLTGSLLSIFALYVGTAILLSTRQRRR